MYDNCSVFKKIQQRKNLTLPTVEEWLVKMTRLAEMAKLTSLFKDIYIYGQLETLQTFSMKWKKMYIWHSFNDLKKNE